MQRLTRRDERGNNNNRSEKTPEEARSADRSAIGCTADAGCVSHGKVRSSSSTLPQVHGHRYLAPSASTSTHRHQKKSLTPPP